MTATELSDEQVARALDALTRPMYMFRMSRANGMRGSDKTYRRALAEARQILTDPAGAPARVAAETQARFKRAQRALHKGEKYYSPVLKTTITVTRVAVDASWADIVMVPDDGMSMWRKRQQLKPDGWFPFGVWRIQ